MDDSLEQATAMLAEHQQPTELGWMDRWAAAQAPPISFWGLCVSRQKKGQRAFHWEEKPSDPFSLSRLSGVAPLNVQSDPVS